MEKKHTNPTTKDAALRQLGVVSKKARVRLGRDIEFVEVASGRALLQTGTFAQSVVVGLSGSVAVSIGDGPTRLIEAPFVLDTWATDDRRIASMTAVVDQPAATLFVDARARHAMFEDISALERLSKRTLDALMETVEPVDARVGTATPDFIAG